MTPEERALLLEVSRKLDSFLDVYYREHFIDKVIFDRDVYMNRTMYIASLSLTDNLSLTDGINIVVGTTTGTQIATGSTQKLGFWGATPVVRPSAVSDASGGTTVDTEARNAINSLLAKLRTVGIITT